ncbi:hypothetical protein M4D68_09675 [Priestia aryabhattai]|uniref:hypothetical protein n=1 Tax=Priestia aryabhattai TaxID=412384 RepID=UPI0020414F65|nr:hypothetical protein [Priestia aryabhattai]MCM3641405.1 hypothetical protein [Priestia aryabhattai]
MKLEFNTTIGEALENGYELVSPKQKEARKQYTERKKHKELGYVLLNRDNVQVVEANLTLAQSGLLMFLTAYMKFNEEGKLFYKGERLTVTEASKLIGKSVAQTRKEIAELEANGLLVKEKVGRNIYLNLSEGFFKCGSVENKFTFIKIFKKRLAEVAQQLSLNELGLLMLMLNHMHEDTHLLCMNPDKKDLKQVVLWRRRDLPEVFGLSKDFVYKTLNKFLQLKITAEVRSINEAVVLHPSLASRKPVTPDFKDILDVINDSLTTDNYKK